MGLSLDRMEGFRPSWVIEAGSWSIFHHPQNADLAARLKLNGLTHEADRIHVFDFAAGPNLSRAAHRHIDVARSEPCSILPSRCKVRMIWRSLVTWRGLHEERMSGFETISISAQRNGEITKSCSGAGRD